MSWRRGRPVSCSDPEGHVSPPTAPFAFAVFQDKPEIPPSQAQVQAKRILPDGSSYVASLLRLLRNLPFMLLVLSYGGFLSVSFAPKNIKLPFQTSPTEEKKNTEWFWLTWWKHVVIKSLPLPSTGINVGSLYTISTLLNRMIIGYYPVCSAIAACVWFTETDLDLTFFVLAGTFVLLYRTENKEIN